MLDSSRDWVGKLTREHANPMAGFARAKCERSELAATHGGAAALANRCGKTERGRGEKQARVLHYLGAELLEGLKTAET